MIPCITPAAAEAAFADAAGALMSHQPDVLPAIDRALAADPYMTSAYLLEGFVNVILARPNAMASAALSAAQAARAASVRGSISPDEVAMLRALEMAVTGHPLAAANVLDERLSAQPDALVLATLSHTLRYMAGDAAGMLRATSEILACNTDAAVAGFVLGLHACALAEVGEYAAALRTGLEAVNREPRDAWAIHAVAHVYEMTGRPTDGVAWLDRMRPRWSRSGAFSHHLAWHLAPFHLELGEHARALELYDQAVRPFPSEDYLDVCNAVSLVFRLRQEGVDVGSRFLELAETARKQRHEPGPMIVRLHNLISLAVVGDVEACWDLLRTIEATADEEIGYQSRVAQTSGVPLAHLLFAAVQPWHDVGKSCKPLDRPARSLVGLGWGHAERDLFMRLLATQAMRLGDETALAGILEERRRFKHDDRFIALLGTARRA